MSAQEVATKAATAVRVERDRVITATSSELYRQTRIVRHFGTSLGQRGAISNGDPKAQQPNTADLKVRTTRE